jgi:hypothetical protein
MHIEMITAKVFRILSRIYSLFKSELLSSDTKLILQKAVISYKMTYAWQPLSWRQTLIFSNCSAYKTS